MRMPPDPDVHNEIVTAQLIEPRDDVALPAGPTLPPCSACGSPLDLNDRFCVACGTPLDVAAPPGNDGKSVSSASHERLPDESASDLPSHCFQCENCGSQVATQTDQRSYACPFCDSTYVVELPGNRHQQQPEFVIGFSVTRAQAQNKYFEWLGKNSWLRPGDLAEKAISEKQRGVYLPFWHFAMQANSRWSARIGQYWYRTETYTVRNSKGKTETRTRRVRETEWWPLAGNHTNYYYGYLVSASRGLPQSEARSIQPFNLQSMTRYRPYFLAGWMSEEYGIDANEAIDVSREEFKRRERQAISAFLPGDTHRLQSVQTHLDLKSTDLILLPVHVLSYRYRDKTFRFLVNGQTGQMVGQKPWSTPKIALLVAGLVLLVAVVVGLLFWGSQLASR
jgi:hypothetical protein